MDRRSSSLLLAFLFILGNLATPLIEVHRSKNAEPNSLEKTLLDEAFIGFSGENSTDFWNQTPWSSIAQPQGFDFLTVYDYSDVGVPVSYTHLTLPTILLV